MKTVDVSSTLDEGRMSAYQVLMVVGTAVTVILDGVDNQLLGNALPKLMTEWSLPRGAFTAALSAGPFGMMLGGLLGGLVGDRVGRRKALFGSALAFGVITFLIGYVNTPLALGILRFLAGVGLGGAMPNAAALASEYVPRRIRPFAVTLTIVCVPLGGMIAGRLTAGVIEAYGWRWLFHVGGVLPLITTALLFKILPESPRFMASRRERWPELRRLMRRLGHDVPDDAVFVDPTEGQVTKSRASIGDLFAPALRRDTLGLCGAFFFCLLALYIGFQLLPVMLTQAGLTAAQGAYGNSQFNAGGVVGAIAGAILIQQFGSRLTLLGMAALGAASSGVMMAMAVDPLNVAPTMWMLLIAGGLMNAVQTTMYALAAHVYPTAIRSTGVGTTVAVGRVGNVLAAYVGNYALTVGAATSIGATRAYFGTWVISMILVFVSLTIVRRHIPGKS